MEKLSVLEKRIVLNLMKDVYNYIETNAILKYNLEYITNSYSLVDTDIEILKNKISLLYPETCMHIILHTKARYIESLIYQKGKYIISIYDYISESDFKERKYSKYRMKSICNELLELIALTTLYIEMLLENVIKLLVNKFNNDAYYLKIDNNMTSIIAILKAIMEHIVTPIVGDTLESVILQEINNITNKKFIIRFIKDIISIYDSLFNNKLNNDIINILNKIDGGNRNE